MLSSINGCDHLMVANLQELQEYKLHSAIVSTSNWQNISLLRLSNCKWKKLYMIIDLVYLAIMFTAL